MENGTYIKLPSEGEKERYLKLYAYYDKGGYNVWNGNRERRGVYVMCQRVERVSYGTYSTEAFVMHDKMSFKVFVKELSRKSDKKVAEMWSKLEPHTDTIFEVWKEGDNYATANCIISIAAQ